MSSASVASGCATTSARSAMRPATSCAIAASPGAGASTGSRPWRRASASQARAKCSGGHSLLVPKAAPGVTSSTRAPSGAPRRARSFATRSSASGSTRSSSRGPAVGAAEGARHAQVALDHRDREAPAGLPRRRERVGEQQAAQRIARVARAARDAREEGRQRGARRVRKQDRPVGARRPQGARAREKSRAKRRAGRRRSSGGRPAGRPAPGAPARRSRPRDARRAARAARASPSRRRPPSSAGTPGCDAAASEEVVEALVARRDLHVLARVLDHLLEPPVHAVVEAGDLAALLARVEPFQQACQRERRCPWRARASAKASRPAIRARSTPRCAGQL